MLFNGKTRVYTTILFALPSISQLAKQMIQCNKAYLKGAESCQKQGIDLISVGQSM